MMFEVVMVELEIEKEREERRSPRVDFGVPSSVDFFSPGRRFVH